MFKKSFFIIALAIIGITTISCSKKEVPLLTEEKRPSDFAVQRDFTWSMPTLHGTWEVDVKWHEMSVLLVTNDNDTAWAVQFRDDKLSLNGLWPLEARNPDSLLEITKYGSLVFKVGVSHTALHPETKGVVYFDWEEWDIIVTLTGDPFVMSRRIHYDSEGRYVPQPRVENLRLEITKRVKTRGNWVTEVIRPASS